MKKKIFGIIFALISTVMIVTPVLAIGPQNANKSNNQNLVFQPWGVQLHLPSGVFNEWICIEPIHIQLKPADFNIGNFNVRARILENIRTLNTL